MITIIHGDDLVSSRKFLTEQKNSLENPIVLNGEELTFENLVNSIDSNSLFSNDKNVFIENLLSRKKSSEMKEIINYLKKSKINVFLWENSELSKSQLTLIPKTKAVLFKIPKTIFSFLDNISPKNVSNIVNFHQTLQNVDAEMIFYMLVRQFRLLIALQENSEDSIDEVQRLAPWQKSKLQRQSKMFSLEELKKTYNKLYKADLNIKTGVLLNLITGIDFLLLEI